jgi:glutamyl-tRNA reductase
VSVLVVGLSHRTAPVSLLESAALPPAAAAKLAADAVTTDHVGEAVVLSTCNRVEVYAEVEKFHGGVADVSERLSRATGLALDALTPHLYVHYEDRAVQHLFSVACGLDSMVVGEGQILGQVRASLRGAQEAGAAGRVLNELVQHALRVGKRAHTETTLDRAGQSLVSVALDEAERTLGSLADRPALVVGAGSMAALAAATLRRRGVGEIVVLNRTRVRAERVAGHVAGRPGGLDALPEALVAPDVVISCTGAVGTVVSPEIVWQARARRGAATQVLLDLALPRDVHPDVRHTAGVRVVDLEQLAVLSAGTGAAPDLDAVRRIVADEVAAFVGWQRASSVAPTVVALRSMASEVVDAELTRLAGRVPALDGRARDEVAATVRRVVDKLLHGPTVRVKELAGEPGGHAYAVALRELFDLDPSTVAAVTRATSEADPPSDPPSDPANAAGAGVP